MKFQSTTPAATTPRKPPSAYAMPERSLANATVLSRSACACGGGCPRCRQQLPVQAKRRVSEPGDVYEREADRVADAVVSGAILHPTLAATGRVAQRLADHESPSEEDVEIGDAEEAATPVQRLKIAGASDDDQNKASSPAQIGTSHGERLPRPVADTLGARIGADFSGVHVHADSAAAQLASDLSARAFASGAHVYFGAGEYRPQTHDGLRVLAHELTHVVQQGAAPRIGGSSVSAPLSTGAAPSVQRMSALASTSRSNLLATNVYPWKGRPPVGSNYQVQTDAGNNVNAWVAYGSVPVNHQYWCHGFSLGTYNNWSYSVYSGKHMQRV
ncbi:MAG TPA: DUF4157 domain-containing protein, partial [Burkholderiales bacterium]|nr:DUF4157 domain-containing protein [Burkholderiales bacterium]